MASLERIAQALHVAKVIAAEIPVRGLSTALQTAFNIVELAKGARDARDECSQLAERAANISLGIYDQLKACSWDGEPAPIATREHVTTLLCTLQDSENMMRRRQKKRLLYLALRQDMVTDEVKKLTLRLEDAMQLFMVQAALDVSQGMDALTGRFLRHAEDSARLGDALMKSARDIDAKCTHILQRVTLTETSDGSLRYFAREDLELLSEDIDVGGVPPKEDQRRRVVRYRAVLRTAPLRDTAVVVHVYWKRDREFSATVDLTRRLWHPNIVSTLGYSRPGDPGSRGFIVTENDFPYEEYLSTLRGAQRYRLILKTWKEMILATEYLADEGLEGILPLLPNLHYGIFPSALAVDPRGAGCAKLSVNRLLTASSEDDGRILSPPSGSDHYLLKDDRATRASILRVFQAVNMDTADGGQIAAAWTRLMRQSLGPSASKMSIEVPGIAEKFRAYWAWSYESILQVGRPVILDLGLEDALYPHQRIV